MTRHKAVTASMGGLLVETALMQGSGYPTADVGKQASTLVLVPGQTVTTVLTESTGPSILATLISAAM